MNYKEVICILNWELLTMKSNLEMNKEYRALYPHVFHTEELIKGFEERIDLIVALESAIKILEKVQNEKLPKV